MHPASLDDVRLLSECDQTFTRRSGPGGQNRNKVETAVILTHRPTGLTAEANERRSQSENRARALFRLRLLLALEIRRSPGETATELWRSRLRGGRIHVNGSHVDFPTLLAEAVDAIHFHDYEAKPAAERLGCSTTQLLGLLRDEPRAFARVNARRSERGKHPYR